MAKIGEHRRTGPPPSPGATVSQFLLQVAAAQDALARAGASQARTDVAFQQDVLRARVGQKAAAVERANADLGGLLERHERPLAARLKALFPSLSAGKGEAVVRRCKEWLRANKPAALAAYSARPMKGQANWVAVESPVTPELVRAVNALAGDPDGLLGKVAARAGAAMDQLAGLSDPSPGAFPA